MYRLLRLYIRNTNEILIFNGENHKPHEQNTDEIINIKIENQRSQFIKLTFIL
jgi:hypothetical protein